MIRILFAALLLSASSAFAQYGHGRSDLRVGETVYTRSGSQTGTVRAIFPNGDVSVQLGYVSLVVKRDDLATEGCGSSATGRLCTGDTVYNASAMEGTVKGFFRNGDVIAQFGYVMLVVNPDSLATQNTRGRLQIGTTVYTRAGQSGTVKGVFGDGKVSVQVGYVQLSYSPDDLAVEGCQRNLCSGQNVINRAGQQGVVLGVFRNGREVVVKYGYVSLVAQSADLARTR